MADGLETCPRCNKPDVYLSDWSGERACRDCSIEASLDRMRCEDCGRVIGRDDELGLTELLGWFHADDCPSKPDPSADRKAVPR